MPIIDKETENKLRPYRTGVVDFLASFVPILPTVNLQRKPLPKGYLQGRDYSGQAAFDKFACIVPEGLKIAADAVGLVTLALCYENHISPIPVILPILAFHALGSLGVFGFTKEFNANARQQIYHLVDPHCSAWVQD